MGGSFSAFKNNFLSNDKKKISNSLNFATTHLQDVTKYHPELNNIIVQIFDIFKQVLDLSNNKNTLSRKILLENISIFGKLPILKLERENQRILINKFTSSITLPIFKLTYVDNEELSQLAFAAFTKLSKYPKLTNAAQFLKFFEDYNLYKDQNDKILRINTFMDYFSKLPPQKFDSRTVIDLFLRFIYQEISKEKNYKIKAVLFNHLTTCFRMKIDFQMSYIEGCLKFLITTIEKCFSTLKEIKLSSKDLKKGKDRKETKASLREQQVDLFLLLKSAYEFGNQIVSLNEPRIHAKYNMLVNLIHQTMQNAHHFRKYQHIIISKNMEFLKLLIGKCGPEQLHTVGNILMIVEEVAYPYYLSFLSSDQGKQMQRCILQFLNELIKWNEIIEIPYWSRKFVKFILLSIVVSFYTCQKELIDDATVLLTSLCEMKRFHYIEVAFVDIIFLVMARYLYINSNEIVKIESLPSIYDIDNYFVDPNELKSAFTEHASENNGQSYLLDNVQSLFIFLEENNEKDWSQLFENVEQIQLSMMKVLFSQNFKTPNIFGFIHQRIVEIKQLEVSNTWNKIFSRILGNDFKNNGKSIVTFDDLEKEVNMLKSKFEQLSCVICYEYLFDGTPVCLQCGHLFCLECIKKASEKDNKCPQCLEHFNGWVKLKSV